MLSFLELQIEIFNDLLSSKSCYLFSPGLGHGHITMYDDTP